MHPGFPPLETAAELLQRSRARTQTGSKGARRWGLGAGTAGCDLPLVLAGNLPPSPATPPPPPKPSSFRAALTLPSLWMVGGFIAVKPWAGLKDS